MPAPAAGTAYGSGMELVPLTEEELAVYTRVAAQQYAEQKISMGGVPEQDAIRQDLARARELLAASGVGKRGRAGRP